MATKHVVRPRHCHECTHVHERAAVGIRPGAGGGESRGVAEANPPGAGTRADAAVGEADVIGFNFRKQVRLAGK